MTERGAGKPWTTYEDNLLIQAVAIHGENDNWKAVAVSVPGRTNKACRKRWLHSLSPNVKKTAWTPEEDQLLLSLYALHGTKWSVIARNISGRTDDACSKRYREALDPSLKRDDWTADEDSRLLESYSRLGGKWGLIGQELSRSGLGCRNRWRLLERKRTAATRGAAIQDPSSSTLGAESQHTADHVPPQESPPWDGRSPQYVTPSMLFNSSPNHPQEARTPVYRPEQILSGVHLAGASNTPPHSQQYQYGNSLDGASSHPVSIAPSPNHHAYYSQATASSSSHVETPLPTRGVTLHAPQPSAYTANDFDMMAMPNSFAAPDPDIVQQKDVHSDPSSTLHSPQHQASLPLHPLNDIGSSVIPESPASPSPVGSPIPLSSPPRTPPALHGGLVATDSSADSAHRPKSYYRSDAEKAQQLSAPRRASNHQRPTRLSSLLPATADASLLAYACGHRECWPAHAATSNSAFSTSKELSDHSKLVHGGDLGGTKPFRCGLPGCERSWKSVNGLQYHLQISKVHFQQALATQGDPPEPSHAVAQSAVGGVETQGVPEAEATSGAPPTTADAGNTLHAPVGTAGDPSVEEARPVMPKRKLHPCPRPGCGKQYKQLSGLRYHLSHGHTDEELPLQLDVLPPTLARMVAEKARPVHETVGTVEQ